MGDGLESLQLKLLDSCLRTLTHVTVVSGQARPPSARPEIMEDDNADEGPSPVRNRILLDLLFFLKPIFLYIRGGKRSLSHIRSQRFQLSIKASFSPRTRSSVA